MTIENYRKLACTKENILDLLAMPEVADVEFEAPKLDKKIYSSEDF